MTDWKAVRAEFPALANWTYPELALHLQRQTGIRIKKSAMAEFCRKHGVSQYRPTYRYLRGDPLKQAKAAAELVTLKKGRKKAGSSS